MAVVVVVGAQWGDEGKGKIVDIYTQHAEMVVRYAGGANAGHTLVVDGKKTILRLIPSGVLHKTPRIVLGQGTAIDPEVLVGEIELLRESCGLTPQRLLISDRAHIVLPHHMQIDALRERTAKAIGTTKRGMGPVYQDKVARRGVRMCDLVHRTRFRERVQENLESWEPTARFFNEKLPTADEIERAYRPFADKLAPFVGNAGAAIYAAIKAGKNVLFEGAQATLLDVDHGTYPYVTSSNTVAGGASTGSGIGPTAIDKVVGITKAYATRVGEGPFPTELFGQEGDDLRKAGHEFGSVTGRPRRCGWLDLPALRYAVRVNGLDSFAMTKIDVLSGLPHVALCTAYELDGERLAEPPPDAEDLARVKPIYETLPGWTGDLSAARTIEELPRSVRSYIEQVERLTECPIKLLSLGADREHTITLANPFL
ncbi:MAG: Adenylosuccinate synthetase [Myxococcaceae bacterium]|nr:Adenylosuccinate synthetase [Myxococcaceae bacterium]